jgi:hypothetical protein
MEVIHTTDLSTYGNDCYIHKSVSLVEEFDMYTVVTAVKITGWLCKRDIYNSKVTCDLDEAKYMYKQAGGILED